MDIPDHVGCTSDMIRRACVMYDCGATIADFRKAFEGYAALAWSAAWTVALLDSIDREIASGRMHRDV